MSILFIENLTHANGDKLLYKNSSLRINKGEHVALLGPNGAGKTTLLNIISEKITFDQGQVELHPKAKMGYLDQHQDIDLKLKVDDYLKDAYRNLYDINDQIHQIYEKMAVEYQEADLIKALGLQEQLNVQGFDQIDKQVGNLVNGLGIELPNLDKTLGELSGGQRGKVLLAKLLLANDDFILLDEPTNFLDVEQVEWLAKFLQNYENSFLLVSHDNDFINQTVNVIYAIENREINRYVGNYNKYLELSQLRKDQHNQAVKSQQQQINKLQEYVAKNKARASTAASAQSRQKQLDKMNVLEERRDLVKPKMNFRYRRPSASVVAKINNLEIGYDFSLLQRPLNFELREGEKAIVKGYNGIGKTTFLKTLAGELNPFQGQVELGNGVSVAFFHQIEQFGEETPIQLLKREYPMMTDSEIRQTIGRFGIKSNLMNHPMNLLSGGEQTKVRLSALSLQPCNLLILDEPTNHIDVLAKAALLEAIQAFEGTVLLTTHDINFETNWADKVLNFEDLV